jgi:predicted GNAT family acetyltransferase
MIRKLVKEDRELALKFLSDEPSINLFLIGDIECFGFHEDFQELWGSFNEEDELEGILLRYHESYIPYYKNPEFDISEFKKIIEADNRKKIISGKEELALRFKDTLPELIEKSTFLCELKDGHNLKEDSTSIKIAKKEDAQRVIDIIQQIEEFQATGTSTVEKIEKVIESKAGRVYYIENEEGEIISVAQTTSENSKGAMIVGVATLKDYRKQGLMSKCLSRLCRDVLAEGKNLCLFYSNPEAGRVYHKLGFVSIDKWTMLIEVKSN